MNRLIASTVAAALFLLVGCGGGGSAGGDTPETISKDIIGNMNAMAAVFSSITDEASAKAAVPKIDSIRANMRSVAARAKAMPKLSAEEIAKSDAEAAKIMPGVMKTMMESRMKLDDVFAKNPKVREIIEPALKDMDKDM